MDSKSSDDRYKGGRQRRDQVLAASAPLKIASRKGLIVGHFKMLISRSTPLMRPPNSMKSGINDSKSKWSPNFLSDVTWFQLWVPFLSIPWLVIRTEEMVGATLCMLHFFWCAPPLLPSLVTWKYDLNHIGPKKVTFTSYGTAGNCLMKMCASDDVIADTKGEIMCLTYPSNR